MEQKHAYNALGFLFLVIQAMSIIRNILSEYDNFFWFCDFVPLLFALAFFTKTTHLAKGLINIGLVPQIVFIGLFFYHRFTSNPVWFVIPQDTTLFYDVSSIILHLATPLALWFTYKVKPSKETIMYTLLVLVAMYSAILAFTASDQYVNYVYSAGPILKFEIPYYTALWIPMVFVVLVIPTMLIQKILYQRHLEKLSAKNL